MDKALREEKERKAAVRAGLKRPASALEPPDVKRLKTEHGAATPPASQPSTSAIDFNNVPPGLLATLIVANLHAFSEPVLQGLVQAYRQKASQGATPTTSTPPSAPTPAPSIQPTPGNSTPDPLREVKAEPIDPLQMDMDDDEMEYEPDRLNEVRIDQLPHPFPSLRKPTARGRRQSRRC
jgi:symplekin